MHEYAKFGGAKTQKISYFSHFNAMSLSKIQKSLR